MAKCSECGFLAARHDLSEVNEDGRNKEISLWGRDALVCIAQTLDFRRATDNEGPGYPPALLLKVLQDERECELFTKWRPGFSPKEHREMIDREAMLKWQTQREDDDRKWRSVQERRLVIIGGIIGGVFTILGGAIGALITMWLSNH